MADPALEEHFVIFVDFLGTRSAIANQADASELLKLLIDLTSLRSEFSVDAKPTAPDGSRTMVIRPAISTFSDNIVISYSLDELRRNAVEDETAAFFILNQVANLVASIAASALRLGFLIRGGAAIGPLYHREGVVFGDALVRAYEIESGTSIYPRVVLSPGITSRTGWAARTLPSKKTTDDGLAHIDYFGAILVRAAAGSASDQYNERTREWFEQIARIISDKLAELERVGRLNELAKWTWFTRQFRHSLDRWGPGFLDEFGISANAIPAIA